MIENYLKEREEFISKWKTIKKELKEKLRKDKENVKKNEKEKNQKEMIK